MSDLIIFSSKVESNLIVVDYELDGNREACFLQREDADYGDLHVLHKLVWLHLEHQRRLRGAPSDPLIWTTHSDSDHQITDTSVEPKAPPRLAEFLFSWIAPAKSLHEQLGDLQEIFDLNVARFGKSRAEMLYWTQVLRAVGPGIWRRIKKLGFIGILIDYGRSKIGW
jgi:hypothetical protein